MELQQERFAHGLEQEMIARGLQTIVEEEARMYGVMVLAVLGRERTQAVVLARHAVWARLRRVTRLSLPEIGAMFDGRNHTTVMHGVRRHEAAARMAVRKGGARWRCAGTMIDQELPIEAQRSHLWPGVADSSLRCDRDELSSPRAAGGGRTVRAVDLEVSLLRSERDAWRTRAQTYERVLTQAAGTLRDMTVGAPRQRAAVTAEGVQACLEANASVIDERIAARLAELPLSAFGGEEASSRSEVEASPSPVDIGERMSVLLWLQRSVEYWSDPGRLSPAERTATVGAIQGILREIQAADHRTVGTSVGPR